MLINECMEWDKRYSEERINMTFLLFDYKLKGSPLPLPGLQFLFRNCTVSSPVN